MAHTGAVPRWELYHVDLDPRVGSEQGGESRAALVVSNDGFNRNFQVVTIVPLTSQAGVRRQVYPFEVLIPAGAAGNPADSIAMPYQVRTISRMRLLERLGFLDDDDLKAAIETRLMEHLGIDFEAEELAF